MTPEINENATEIEKACGMSIDVLVKVKGFAGLRTGRYVYGVGCWIVDGLHGEWTVEEWWYLPEKGSGHSV